MHDATSCVSTLQAQQFVKLARDCQLIGSSMSEADPPLMEADVQARSDSSCELVYWSVAIAKSRYGRLSLS